MDNNYYVMIATSPWAGPSVDVISQPNVRTNRGKVIGEIPSPYKVTLITDEKAPITEDFPPRDIHESAKFTLFSRKFIDTLSNLDIENIEYLPAEVTDQATNKTLDYSVANIVKRITALDEEKSDFIFDSHGNIMGVGEMVFDESKIQNHKIFLLSEVPSLIIVHESIKNAVESENLTGFLFIADKDYDGEV